LKDLWDLAMGFFWDLWDFFEASFKIFYGICRTFWDLWAFGDFFEKCFLIDFLSEVAQYLNEKFRLF